MKTSKRFDNAVTKLYNAFHNGELNSMSCSRCAVGNICDNKTEWNRVTGSTLRLENYVGDVKEIIDKTGYSPQELSNIEALFMFGSADRKTRSEWADVLNGSIDFYSVKMTKKEAQFKGLCAVVEYLCELDNIPNLMDYTSLFEYDDLGATKGIEILIEV